MQTTTAIPASLESERPTPAVSLRLPKSYHCLELILELVSLGIAWLLTSVLRVGLNPFFERKLTLTQMYDAAPGLPGIFALWILTRIWLKGRDPARGRFQKQVDSAIVASAVTIVVTFFSQGVGAPVSRSFVLLFAPTSYLVLLLGYTVRVTVVSAFLSRWPVTVENVAVIGDIQEASQIAQRIRSLASGVNVAGIVVPPGHPAGHSPPGIRLLGSSGQLAALINSEGLDRIIIADGCLSERDLKACLSVARRMNVALSRTLDLPSGEASVKLVTEFGLHLLDLRPLTIPRVQEVIKRIIDLQVALLLLVLLAPLLFLIAVLIKLTSKGPVLHKAPRVGKGGRHFTFLKFRSMSVESDLSGIKELNEKQGHLFKIRHDPRVTSIGRILRRYSLDELPQLLNVVRGEMSLIGPRPLPAENLDADGMSRQFAYWAEQRARVLPGITGLWQVRGRSDLTFQQTMDLDIEYIRNWSLFLDLEILLETPFVVLTGRGAY